MPAAEAAHGAGPAPGRWPTDFRYEERLGAPRVRALRRSVRTLTGHDPVPSPKAAEAFRLDMFTGDPLAEACVADALSGEPRSRGRQLLDTALESPDGFAAVAARAPETMRALFTEFETVPEWVEPARVEEGARIWRRWGRTLFNVAGAETLEMYTESAVALPLSLSGGYAGDNALRRFLETVRFWIDVSEPGALFRLGSAGRATALRVRIMHVSVRARVGAHPEWDETRWGVPISQAWMTMTLMGGSIAPAALMWPLGYMTTPGEVRALLHYQRFLGHLLGVHPRWYPETVTGALQLMVMTSLARTRTAGAHGAELIESFPRAFAPRPGQRGLARLRARYEHRLMGAYTAACMSPRTRRRHDMPPAFPWLLLLAARVPLVAASEAARHLVPGAAGWLERRETARREAWWTAQMAGRTATFEAESRLRR